jgi:hypothetical protein
VEVTNIANPLAYYATVSITTVEGGLVQAYMWLALQGLKVKNNF